MTFLSPFYTTPITTPLFPVADITTVYPVIGSPALYKEVVEAIQRHGDSSESIRIRQSFQETRAPITTRLFKDLKLSGEGKRADSLFLRSMEVFTSGGDEKGTVSFLVFLLGGKESNAILLSAAYLLGDEAPINRLELVDGATPGTKAIRFYSRGQEQTYDPSNPSDTVDTVSTPLLYEALFNAQAFFINSLGFLTTLQAASDIGMLAEEAAKKSATLFYNQFAVPFLQLDLRRGELPEPLKPFARAMTFQANQTLALPQGELDLIAEMTSRSHKLIQDALDAFRWQEGEWANKPMTRAEFYSVLEETADPEKRRNLVEHYSAAVLEAHKKGLFPMINRLNAIARQYGYASYPDFNDRVFFGMTPKEFAEMVEAFHEKYGITIADFIDELRGFNGGRPVYEWDVDYLTQKYIESKTGKEIPKLTFDEALKIAKIFFKDLGLDLDSPPFAGKIFFDMKKRENKYGNAFAQALNDGSSAWFNTNFDPAEKITLTDLNTIIHELTHDIQFILGSRNGRGNVVTGYGAWPTTWVEGSAMTMGDIVYNSDWMDRYLSDLEGFQDPNFRKTAAEALTQKNLYTNMMVLCRALWENGLYEDKDVDGRDIPFENRLRDWEIFAQKYMHVRTMNALHGGYVYATPHFAGMPAYYAGYGGGRTLGVAVMEPMVAGLAKQDEAMLRRGGQVLARVLERGSAILTAPEIATAIEEAKRTP